MFTFVYVSVSLSDCKCVNVCLYLYDCVFVWMSDCMFV